MRIYGAFDVAEIVAAFNVHIMRPKYSATLELDVKTCFHNMKGIFLCGRYTALPLINI